MNGLANDVEKDRTIVRRAPVLQTCFRFASVGVAELSNLSFCVDAETFNVAVAFHFGGPHDATNPPKCLIDCEYDGNRPRRISFGILPVRLDLPSPSAVQVGKRNEPALQPLPAPTPFHEEPDKKKIRADDLWNGLHEFEEIPHV